MVKMWLPSCLMDMPMRPRLGQSLASAHAWLVDAVLVPPKERLRVWNFLSERAMEYSRRVDIETARSRRGQVSRGAGPSSSIRATEGSSDPSLRTASDAAGRPLVPVGGSAPRTTPVSAATAPAATTTGLRSAPPQLEAGANETPAQPAPSSTARASVNPTPAPVPSLSTVSSARA